MKKVLFAALALVFGFWSCTQNEDPNPNSDGYVNVKISSKTQDNGLRSIVTPDGATSWNVGDKVVVIDADNTQQLFSYTSPTPKSSGEFNGRLKSGQGSQIYRAFHAPKNCGCKLEENNILVLHRDHLTITDKGIDENSILFGTYCPMIAIPLEFNAENEDDKKTFQFYHLNSMIEARVTLRDVEDAAYLSKLFDEVVFEVRAIGSKPFFTKIEVDMDLFKVDSQIEDLDECIISGNDESNKTDQMYTIKIMQEQTIRDLMDEYDTYYPIPIFALPTEDDFNYSATVIFKYKGEPQLKMSGTGVSTGLNPAGLNILNFDYKKIVTN